METDTRQAVLLVDDDPLVLKGFRLLLGRRYDLYTAVSAYEGLDIIREKKSIRVIVSDIKMPGMDGIAFLTKVKKLRPSSIRIVLTGYAEADVAINAVNQGSIFRFLTKPCPPEKLKEGIDDGLVTLQLEDELLQAKSLFLSNMSHELRTPLNGLLGTLHLMECSDLDSEQQMYVEMSLMSVKRLTATINSVLEYIRINRGPHDLRMEPVSIPKTLADVRALFLPQCTLKQLDLHTHSDTRLPEVLLGDEQHVAGILGHLVSNACKFTEKGSVRMEAYPLPQRTDAELKVLFSVADTGIGLDPSKYTILFEPFTQNDSTETRKYEGMGLGLPLVKELVLKHRGTITVDSEPGEGTAVYFCLPFQMA